VARILWRDFGIMHMTGARSLLNAHGLPTGQMASAEGKSNRMLDQRDIAILDILQRDSETPVFRIAEKVHLSPSACSRRIAELRRLGYIVGSVVRLDRDKLGLPITIFVIIGAKHSAEWLRRFRAILADIPEVLECHRLTGQADYVLKLAVPSIQHYDDVYKRLISGVEIDDVAAYISMETIKDSQALPLEYIGQARD
jgi:Lrp/AsnC family transcriptional regulator